VLGPRPKICGICRRRAILFGIGLCLTIINIPLGQLYSWTGVLLSRKTKEAKASVLFG
jgi:hypothetical protein